MGATSEDKCCFDKEIMLKQLSKIEDLIILFLFIFGLMLPVVRTSSLLLLVLLPLRFVFSNGILSIVKAILLSKYILRLAVIYLLLICITISSTIINLTFDFTLIPTLINAIFHLVAAVMVVALFLHKKRSLRYVEYLLIGIFILQSLIQIVAFISPAVLQLVQNYQSSATIERASAFGGRRGLALAGTVFFGLSSIYGIIFFFLTKIVIDKGKVTIWNVVCMVLILVGGFFTGRTFFIGAGMASCYFLCSSLPINTKIRTSIKVFCYLIFMLIFLVWIIPRSYYDKIYNLLLYVFEAAFNFIDTGHATTTSSAHLMDDMYFPISFSTFLTGDGCYTGLDGGYYMNTDAGYMRNLLLFGIIGLIVCVLFDYFLLWGSWRFGDKRLFKFNFFIFLYLCVLHVKGEAFAYLITIHCILFVYYIFYQFGDNRSLSTK